MKPIRLIELFRHITEQTTCPNCKARISPDSIEINASTDQAALLTIHCPACKKDLQAHVALNIADPNTFAGFEKNMSDISETELQEAQIFLRSFRGDISSLFSLK